MAKRPQQIRAICFDLDNTLWDIWPVIRNAEQAMYEYLRERYPRVVAVLTLEAMREAREQTAAKYPLMKHDFTFLRKQTLREHAQEFGYAECMVEEAFEVFIQARNRVEFYDDVLPGLSQLKNHFRLFSASNGNADLEQIGLANFFERSVSARMVGAMKPDPAIFHKTIEGTGLVAEEVIYVGDDPLLDVVGARNAGMHPVWIDRLGEAWPVDIEPPLHTVKRVTDLAHWLANT